MTALDLASHQIASIGAVLSLSDGLAELARGRTRPIPLDDILGVLAEHGLHVLRGPAVTHAVILGGRGGHAAALLPEDEARGLAEVAARVAPDWSPVVAEIASSRTAMELVNAAREADLASNAAAIAEQAGEQAYIRLAASLERACGGAAGPVEPVTEEIVREMPLERAS